MNAIELLSNLRHCHINLSINDSMLSIDAPKGAIDQRLKNCLSECKRELMDILRDEQENKVTLCPLSHGQRALWYVHQLDPEGYAYNVAFSAHIFSSLDINALRRSCQRMIDRHSVLRTTFSMRNGVPVQVVHNVTSFVLEIVDANNWTDETLIENLNAAYRRPFDLEKGPLFRVTLFQRSPEDSALLIAMPHIVVDGWSLWLLLDEIQQTYPAELANTEASLPVLSSDYSGFVGWQQEVLGGEQGERLWNYWNGKLNGVPELLDIPLDYSRPQIQTYNGSTRFLRVSKTLFERIQSFCHAQGVTLYATLLAVFQVLLHRYTNQDCFAIGSPLSGRGKLEFEKLVGYFVNPLVVRADFTDRLTFQEHLQNVRKNILEALDYQDFPFPLLVERMQLTRDAGRSPLFQVSFVMQRLQRMQDLAEHMVCTSVDTRLHFGGLQIRPIPLGQQEGLFDLTMEAVQTTDSLIIEIKYNTDLFKQTTIDRMLDQYRELLNYIIENPAKEIDRYPIITNGDRNKILNQWNNTDKDISNTETIVDLFESQAIKNRDGLALVYKNQSLPYEEVNRRANRLAWYLRKLQIGPETLVGVFLDSCLETPIVILAIMKAGGAYLPIDPSYPKERSHFIIEDARPRILITKSHLTHKIVSMDIPIVEVDKLGISNESNTNLSLRINPRYLAYVIYTSGSTGKPKGVLIEHKGLTNLVTVQKEKFKIDRNERVLQFASLSFDASVVEILVTLTSGATLCLEDRDIMSDGEGLINVIKNYQITNITLPPSLLAVLDPNQFPTLRSIISAGEDCAADIVNRWVSKVKFFNAYGPTECSVCTSISECTEIKKDKPSIGKPITNFKVHIVDKNLELLPIGIPGELFIQGIGEARGYLNRPDLTAERFLPCPYGGGSGSRMYRTGDVARWREEGEIEFLGRLDGQVKVRGFRIELGEIESALREQAGVRDAAAALREEDGRKRLVGYVVLEEGGNLEKIRTALRERLPDYMTPTTIVRIGKIPLTPNGKVDRRALPAPEDDREKREAYAEPRTEAERILARIWSETLHVERVGIHENFFDLGGDSILSIQILSRAAQAGLQFKPQAIFQHQTVAALAAAARQTRVDRSGERASGPIPPTPIQCWFYDKDYPDPQHWNQGVTLRLNRPLEGKILETALQAVIAHHDGLRLRARKTPSGAQPANSQEIENNGWRQEIQETAKDGTVANYDYSHLSEEESAPALRQLAESVQASLDLQNGPLLRAAYVRMGERQQDRLILVIHHLLVDGVSWRILLDDLQTAYRQREAGRPIELPPKTTAFRTWANLLRDYAQTEAVTGELDYWRNAARRTKDIPIDFPEGTNTADSARTVTSAFSEEETRALLQEIPKTYKTQINDALLAALAQTVCPWANAPDGLRIDLESHGREAIDPALDLSRTVGWFTALFPAWLTLPPGGDPGAALRAIKAQRAVLPQNGLSYGLLRWLHADEAVRADFARTPNSQICFNYLGQFDSIAGEGSLFEAAWENCGAAQSPRQPRAYPLEINGGVVDGRLQVNWTYSANLHRRETIQRLADNYRRRLRELIAHSRSPQAERLDPADFPDVRLTADDLEEIRREQNCPPREIESIYPLTPLQQGMLFHTLYDRGEGAYVVQLYVDLIGDLDAERFHRAWQTTLERHPSLRGLFLWENRDEPLQVTRGNVTLPWSGEDWSQLTGEGRERYFEELLARDRAQGFALNRPPLMRVRLIRWGENRHRLLWSLHHLLLDGWSMARALGDVADAYRGRAARPPRPFIDYVRWLKNRDREESQRFWQTALSEFTEPSRLAIENRTAAPPTYDERQRFLSQETTESLKRAAKENQITINALAQGAWTILAGRYSGREEVTVGVTESGRPAALAGVDEMVGMFINTLPVRARVNGEAMLADWLRELQTRQAEIRAHQYDSPTEIQQWAKIPAQTPLFEQIFIFENYPLPGELLPGLRIENARAVERTGYPLTVVAAPGERLSIEITYDESRYESGAIERLLGHLVCVLEGMARGMKGKVRDVPLLSEDEYRTIVEEWNRTERPYAKDRCIHQLFEEQVERAPEAVAVRYEGESLTYAEFNRRANRLAWRLRKEGVTPDARVGLCVERSVEMVVGLYAILKAGGAYVPLDPSYPEERLRFMAEDAGLKIVVTQRSLKNLFARTGATQLALDEIEEDLEREPDENPPTHSTPQNLAYLIYTSGSTGKPKGCQIAHQSLVNYIDWVNNYYFRTNSSGNFGLYSSLSFDLTVTSIFSPLLRGKTLTIYPHRMDVDEIIRDSFDPSSPIDIIKITPAHIALLDRLDLPATNIQAAIVGGEQLTLDQIRTLEKLNPMMEIYNEYGPTEGTVGCIVKRVSSRDDKVLIGKPICNTKIYILGDDLNPAPIGVPGELFIGGDILSLGYINKPEVTNRSFINNPFLEGERIYKTGDRAVWLENGEIECLGRNDDQVKIRGYRIDLGEIDAVLAQHPKIRNSLVLARDDSSGAKRLIAFYVERETLDKIALRDYLAEKLPDYMIPSAFVKLDTFPLTRNGKIDRQALPALNDADFSHSEFAVPQTPAEELVAGIWSETLHVRRVGRNDNFFELGGHSLVATQVISRIRKIFSKEIPLRLLFEYPTVSEFALALERERSKTIENERFEIIPINRSAEIPLSFAQQRLWFLDQLEPGSTAYNVPGAIRLRGRLDRSALEKSIGSIIDRHEILRMRVRMEKGEPHPAFDEFAGFTLATLDLKRLPGAEKEKEINKILFEDSSKPFDLERDCLIRVQLLEIDDDDFLLLLNFHHIVSDGWSVGILIKELTSLYRAYVEKRDPQLPHLPIQYADFAVGQRQWLNEKRLAHQLNYWRETLQGLETLELRTDFPRPSILTYNGSSIPFSLDEDTVQPLEAACRKAGVTSFMFLLTAFQVFLSRLTGQEDVAVGSPISGRTHVEIENLIGFFVNTLVLRANLSGDPSVETLLRQVRETTLDAFAHQDVPFERLVDFLQPARDRSRSPLFQVMFSLQDWQSRELELPEIKIEEYTRESNIAKFDLTLSLVRSESGIRGAMEYNTDLFEAVTIVRWLSYLSRLIRGMLSSPQIPISQIPILSDEERNLVVSTWNQSQRVLQTEKTIHAYFERQAALTPDAIALVYEDRTLTYDELNRRSNQVAHCLLDRGLRAGDLVGICFERSLEMVIAMYAAIKAGAAYVPLDPEYPKDRLGGMMENLRLILTVDYLRDRLPNSDIPILVLDSEEDRISRYGEDNPSLNLTPDYPVYVLFTSGSSGRPKGVAITHGALINHMLWYLDAFSLREDDAVLQKTVFTFDSSVCEFYAPLMAGARLVLARRAAHGDWRYLIDAIQRNNITLLQVVPTVLELLVKDPGFSECQSLRVLISGGEALSAELIERVTHRLNARLYNLYGPTEVTIDAAYRHCVEKENRPIVPIGRPIWNIQTYILDRHFEPTPPGVPGELYLGGTGLAMGYLDQPDITAERFIPNPYSSISGARMYRTGDLARFSPDGEVEYLGRIDQQVKVRGNRVELGEIEAVLRGYPPVKEAVAHVWKSDRSDPQLVAYVSVKNQQIIDLSEMFAFLRDRLPPYMLPSSITVLESLPVFPSGKINRRALPEPSKEKDPLADSCMKPRNSLEERLVKIWSDVLQSETVGRTANFFEIGGHSIKAVLLVNRIQEELNVRMPLSQIFQSPTIEKLAIAIEEMARYRAEYEDKQYLLFNGERDRKIFCFPPLLGYGFAYKRMASGIPSHSVYAFDFLDSESRVQTYVRWIQELQPAGAIRLLGYSAGGNLAFEAAKELEKSGRAVSDIILLDAIRIKNKRGISELEIKTTIRDNLNYFADYMMKDGDLKMFVANDYVREQMAVRMRAYLRYLNESPNAGAIHANIHLIKSSDQSHTTDCETGWPEVTLSRFLSYQGFGRHGDMVDDAFVEKNAALIEAIINR